MIKKFFISLILFLLIIQSSVIDTSFAITAEERLEEVEKQLIAVNQIKQYEGEKTDLEKAILANDAAIKKVNDELAVVQKELIAAELALDKALEGYDEALNNLAAVQQNILEEQVTLGVTKMKYQKSKMNYLRHKNLNSAKDQLQEKAVDIYQWSYESSNSIVCRFKWFIRLSC